MVVTKVENDVKVRVVLLLLKTKDAVRPVLFFPYLWFFKNFVLSSYLHVTVLLEVGRGRERVGLVWG